MLKRTEMMAAYSRELRMEAPPGFSARIERAEGIVRCIGVERDELANRVLFSSLTASRADRVIEEQVDHFRALGRSFRWAVFEDDPPGDLVARLTAHGFEAGPTEVVMALDITGAEPPRFTPPGITIRPISDRRGLADVMETQDIVWNGEWSWLGERLARDLDGDPSKLAVYCAYAGSRPVSTAWTRFGESRKFATLHGLSTVPEHRGRGICTAMVAVSAEETRRRGAIYLAADAGAMSRPILEKSGFLSLITSTPCIWRHPALHGTITEPLTTGERHERRDSKAR